MPFIISQARKKVFIFFFNPNIDLFKKMERRWKTPSPTDFFNQMYFSCVYYVLHTNFMNIHQYT